MNYDVFESLFENIPSGDESDISDGAKMETMMKWLQDN